MIPSQRRLRFVVEDSTTLQSRPLENSNRKQDVAIVSRISGERSDEEDTNGVAVGDIAYDVPKRDVS
jgi:hypothetical protein